MPDTYSSIFLGVLLSRALALAFDREGNDNKEADLGDALWRWVAEVLSGHKRQSWQQSLWQILLCPALTARSRSVSRCNGVLGNFS